MRLTLKEQEKYEKAKIFFGQIKQSDDRINSSFAELRRLKELKYSISSSITTDESGSIVTVHTQKQSTDAAYVNVIARIDELEKKIEEETQAFVKLREKVYDVIETAYNEDAKSVLWHKYIDGMTNENIAEKLNFSERQIRRIHKRALISVKIE